MLLLMTDRLAVQGDTDLSRVEPCPRGSLPKGSPALKRTELDEYWKPSIWHERVPANMTGRLSNVGPKSGVDRPVRDIACLDADFDAGSDASSSSLLRQTVRDLTSSDDSTSPLRSLREDLTDQLQHYGITHIPPIKLTGYKATAKLDDLTVELQQRFVPQTERVLSVRATCPDCWLEVTSMDLRSKQDFLDALARPFSTHICRGQARGGGL